MNPLISTEDLAQRSAAESLVLLDARFRLDDAEAGERLFREGHIPGARYVDLNRDLSGPRTGENGCHPFPEKGALRALFSRLGIGADTPVVAYDDTDHAGAARAWALLRWLGHENVQVLNGGLKAWSREGRPLETGPARPPAPASFPVRAPRLRTFQRGELLGQLLVDARAPERFRGEREPIDPRAGHIPGAKNLPYATLLQPDGTFRAPSDLAALLGRFPEPVFYCGSGVTACVAVLAGAAAGRDVALYPGSWSEWCADPGAPVATGADG
jgi:thiosulfate/3-mercaptopyruvate sulfurtransferase